MDWQQIREQYPHRWVVVEALEAHSSGGLRVIEQMALIEPFEDNWDAAWECYKRVHYQDKQREYYVLHTDNAELEIEEFDVFRRPMVE